MDSKALAKSKRAHSQHHSKKYHSPNQKAKDGAKPNKASGKQIPTNWDRYDEELDSGSQDAASDIVLPKSKGADYTHLIAEAQSQSLSQFDDDVLSVEWNKGIMSMLSARGESILSWIGDDNFVVDDKTAAAHHEVSFLSLNLHSLAEQLEKVDLSERLFIEADLLPPELNPEGLESTSSQSADQVQGTFVNKGARVILEASISGEFPEKIDVADQDIEIMLSSSPDSDCLDSNLGSISLKQIDVDPSKHGKSTRQSSVKPFADIPIKNLATFEAATVELDMLLDSFSETKINDPSALRSLQEEASVPSLQVPRKGTDPSILMAANLDDALDDLMNEISIPINQGGPSRPQEKMAVHDFQSSHTGSKSKVDDFDSWFDTL